MPTASATPETRNVVAMNRHHRVSTAHHTPVMPEKANADEMNAMETTEIPGCTKGNETKPIAKMMEVKIAAGRKKKFRSVVSDSVSFSISPEKNLTSV
jgi:hypothetical protein